MEKDRAKAKQLFAEMSLKEKVKYIRDYYGLRIVCAILAAAVLAGTGIAMYRGRAQSKWLHVGSTAPYSQRLRPHLEALGEENGEPLNYMELLSVEGENSADGMTQLSCYLAADQIDILVCDEPTRQYLQVQEEEDITVYPLAETTLAALFEDVEQPELYLVVRHGLSRSERAEAFVRLLVTDTAP